MTTTRRNEEMNTHALRTGLTLAAALVALTTLPGDLWAAEKDAPTQILITNVDVWDGTSDTVSKGTDVLIEGNKIKQVGKGLKASGAHVIDGKGGTVTPGLIDMHQHLMLNGGTGAGSYDWDAYTQGAHASRAAEYLLKSGFTTVRDIAGNSLSRSSVRSTRAPCRARACTAPGRHLARPGVTRTGGPTTTAPAWATTRTWSTTPTSRMGSPSGTVSAAGTSRAAPTSSR